MPTSIPLAALRQGIARRKRLRSTLTVLAARGEVSTGSHDGKNRCAKKASVLPLCAVEKLRRPRRKIRAKSR